MAPGEDGWAICTPDAVRFSGCTDFKGAPSPIEDFGGTSEAAPFIAGGAALVIEAYKKTHNGVRPSPALVKQILTSTATDLGLPATQQGAGEMNTYRAVQLAMSVKDSMIAATALVHRLTVATRNRKDFRKAGVKVFDPFA